MDISESIKFRNVHFFRLLPSQRIRQQPRLKIPIHHRKRHRSHIQQKLMESQWLELLFQCIFRLSFHLHDLAIPTDPAPPPRRGHLLGPTAADGLIDGFCYLFLIDTKKLL